MDRALTDTQARDCYPAMLRLALSLARGDRQAAEDVTQDAFVKQLRWPGAAPSRAWMCHLVKCAAVDHRRREARHDRDIPLVEWETAGGGDDPERAACLRETLAEVAAQPWGGLLLADAAGWRHAELAARLGVSRGCVQVRLHRLRHGPIAHISPY
jgi:DNA-directed RNA polymerase specialized sigma24 family protein